MAPTKEELVAMSDEQLSGYFDKAQQTITAAQELQTLIDRERRRRVAASQIEQKRAELAALESDLEG